MTDLMGAMALTVKLRSDFKSVADFLGAEKAFYLFAGQVVEAGYPLETERKFVAIVKAVYDDYVGAGNR